MLRRVVSFGTADCGRLGQGLPLVSLFYPRPLPALDGAACTDVAAGGAHSLVLAGDGSVLSFGLNDRGQLGHSPRAEEVPEPREVLLPEAAVAVAAGDFHSLALTADGRVWTWGDGTGGALGLGPGAPTVSAPRLLADLKGTFSCWVHGWLDGDVFFLGGGGGGVQ